MSLTLATLIPGLLLLVLGGALLSGHALVATVLKALPRSQDAAYLFFGTGAAWFLYKVLDLSPADFGEYRTWLFLGFTVVAVLSFKFVPDFLAVRGLCVLTLLSASPLLAAGYMNFEHWQINFYKVAVYLAIALAIWLGAQPYWLRDFFQWLFASRARPRVVGGVLAAYGLLLAVVAFTY